MNQTQGPRQSRVAVRVNSRELAVIKELAKHEFLTPCGLLRRLALREAEQVGIPTRERERTLSPAAQQ